MKKLLLSCLAIAATTLSFAQFSFGVQTTGNLSSATYKDDSPKEPTKTSRILAGGGLFVSYAINEKLGLSSGVNFLQHGVKLKTEINNILIPEIQNVKGEATATLNYLQLPMYATYTSVAPNTRFFAGAGPFVSYGIGGKVESKVIVTYKNGNVEEMSDKSKAFKKDAEGKRNFKQFDAGVGAVAGVKLSNGLFATIGYQYSLVNIAGDEPGTYKNRGMQLSVGYLLTRN